MRQSANVVAILLCFIPVCTDGVSAEQRLRAFTGSLLKASVTCPCTRNSTHTTVGIPGRYGQRDNDLDYGLTLLRQNLEPQNCEIVARRGNEVPRPRVHHEF